MTNEDGMCTRARVSLSLSLSLSRCARTHIRTYIYAAPYGARACGHVRTFNQFCESLPIIMHASYQLQYSNFVHMCQSLFLLRFLRFRLVLYDFVLLRGVIILSYFQSGQIFGLGLR